jgi:murein DD-endopeptidase MepM/ murein hydrolase activator NlpD
MSVKVALIASGVTAGAILMCGGVLAPVAIDAWDVANHPGSAVDATKVSCTGTGGPTIVNVAATRPAAVEGFSTEQVTNATTIIHVGQQLNVPPRGWIVAVATAMQESRLYNLGDLGSRNDHDSLGLFQQRPSQGWGAKAEVMDPVYASRKFYEALAKVGGWQQMSLTQAAQKVQKSAFPNAYAKHEPAATKVVNAVSGGAGFGDATLVGQCAQLGKVTAGGWTVPVVGAEVGEGLGADRGDHRHAGVDLIIGRHHPIVAASDGVVVVVKCQASVRKSGAQWGCDRDGSPQIKGCGWYVDVKHAGGVYTRYCHMQSQPIVTVGQQVKAGQQLGWSGTSGGSSGPHLHFEVHINNNPHAGGVTDPIKWMKDHGAPLDGKAA